jgi:TPP-dependent pyruvate/acetoin dehydrogenase alpha subunit
MIDEIFKRMCEIRYFELELVRAMKADLIDCPVYLSIGQESIAASLSVLCPDYRVFPQHRGNSWYLAFGGDPKKLRDEFLGMPSGCSGGKGGSDVGCDKVEAHHGLIGENAPIGVGYALATKKSTIIPMGDGSVEEDCFLPSLGFAVTHQLPVLFVCEDNGLAILTPIKDRRTWNIVSVVKGFGMNAIDISDDPKIISTLDIKLPMLINIRTSRLMYHVGAGQDFPLGMDRLNEVRKFSSNYELIENTVKLNMENLWNTNV